MRIKMRELPISKGVKVKIKLPSFQIICNQKFFAGASIAMNVRNIVFSSKIKNFVIYQNYILLIIDPILTDFLFFNISAINKSMRCYKKM